MKKFRFLLLTGMIFSLFAMNCADKVMTEEEIVAEATRIHGKVMTMDTHIDISPDLFTDEINPSMRLDDIKVDVPKMEEGGLDVAFFAVYTGQTERTEEGYAAAKAEAFAKFEAVHRLTDKYAPDKIGFSDTADETIKIYKSGKKVAMIGIENGYVIGKDISLLKTYRDLGARYMTLSHSGHNDICDSSAKKSWDVDSEHNGVSEFGKEVIAEMNKLGILVDVAHISHKSLMDAVELSKAPVIASHSAMNELNPHNRNISDEGLLAIKENGGVVHIVALGSFLKNGDARRAAFQAIANEYDIQYNRRFANTIKNFNEEKQAEINAKLELLENNPATSAASVKDLVDHVDHAVKIMGIEHVGIGSDFDGGGAIKGWNDASETLNVTIELVRRGYSEIDIAKIWGGNILRALREAEEVAKDLQ